MPAPARTPPVPPSRSTRPSRVKRNLLAVGSLGLAGLVPGLLSGCGSGLLPTTTANSYAPASGNWQFTSTASASARLTVSYDSYRLHVRAGTIYIYT